MNRSCVIVSMCLSGCTIVAYVLLLSHRRNNVGNGELTNREALQYPVIKTKANFKICIHTNVCKYDSNDLIYEYRRTGALDLKERKENVLPNIVHYAYFRGRHVYFRFHELLSIMALTKTMKMHIYFWFDFMPFGENWDKLRTFNIFFIHRYMYVKGSKHSKISYSLGERVKGEAVLEFGGIGLSFDIVLVKSLHKFFDHDTTMGTLPSEEISPDIIISKPRSAFMRMWYSKNMNFNDPLVPIHKVAQTHKHLVTIVANLVKPSQSHMKYLYREGLHLEWRSSVTGIKLWHENHGVEHSPRDIRGWNTTAGELFRYIVGVKIDQLLEIL